MGFTKSQPPWSRIVVYDQHYGKDIEYYEEYIKTNPIWIDELIKVSILNYLLKEEEFIWKLEEELLKLI